MQSSGMPRASFWVGVDFRRMQLFGPKSGRVPQCRAGDCTLEGSRKLKNCSVSDVLRESSSGVVNTTVLKAVTHGSVRWSPMRAEENRLGLMERGGYCVAVVAWSDSL